MRPIVAELEALSIDPELRRLLSRAVEWAEERGWETHFIHGDLSTANVVRDLSGGYVLIDWGSVKLSGLIAVDLMRLYYDCYDEIVGKRRRGAVLPRLKGVMREAFGALGYTEQDYYVLELLLIAEQACLALPAGGSHERHYQIFKSRVLSLSA